jgi:hypothetical protein
MMVQPHDDNNPGKKDPTVEELIENFQCYAYWSYSWTEEGRRTHLHPTLDQVDILIKDGRPEAMIALVGQWAKWIAVEHEPALQESAAREMSRTVASWMPLTDKLVNGFDKKFADQDVMNGLTYDAALESGADRQVAEDAWRNKDNTGKAMDNLREKYKDKVQLKWETAQLRVRRRIAQLLAEMSNPRAFDAQTIRPQVDDELKGNVTGPLARLLTREADLEVRESIARVLGNINTPDAIEAMVNAVAGEERRHDTLDKYYLEPSRRRSLDTEGILNGVVNEARHTLKLTQYLNLSLFAVGLVFLATGLLMSILSKDFATRVISAIAAFGGLGSIITIFITDPLKRIQNGVANLTEIETAFTSFIRELDLNDTYIQSQYLANGVLSDKEIQDTGQRIEKARSSTMEIVQTYAEVIDVDPVSHMDSLSPTIGQADDEVTIKGRFVPSKKGKTPAIVIDHEPTLAKVTSSDINEVMFKLPTDATGSATERTTVWISLIVEGVETNALPFVVVQKKQPEKK